MSPKPRLGIFKMLVTCPNCGKPFPVNGPLHNPVCTSCQLEVPISADIWKDILEEYLESYSSLDGGSGNDSNVMGELNYKVTSVKLPPPDPACPKCEENWDLPAIADGTDGMVTCKKCGYKTPTYPVPEWLDALGPSARQVFFAEREQDPTGAPDPSAAETKPIALTCPQCNGSLLVTAGTGRTLQCKYCGVDVFLPDALWLKLHPAKVAKFWLVRFQP